MKNQYKRSDIFRCTHESHQGFGNVVSAYHVLKEKGCYPQGCIYFKWKCRKLERGLPCPRSYEHVGRKCAHCADYYDEKIVKRPQLLLDEKEYQSFLKELRSFEIWLDDKKGRQVNCAGRLKTVKPRFIMNRYHDRTPVVFQGFLLEFEQGFINYTSFNDTFYALISTSQQSRYKLSAEDKLEFQAILRLDRGRLILDRLRSIEIEEKNGNEPWTIAEAKRALMFGKVIDYQYEKCLHCRHGFLIDVKESEFASNGFRRRKLLCLKGVSQPEYCLVQVKEKFFPVDSCQGGTSLK